MPAKKQWVYSPPRASKPKAPERVKAEVQARADELVETFLKPNFVKEPPEDVRWNYVVDIYTKWYRNYLYFGAKYHSRSENRIADYFEVKFTRLEYTGDNRFSVAYMRHTEKWQEIYFDLSLDECLERIREDPFLQP